MPDLVFIVEEPSKETFLRAFLSRFDIPPNVNVYYKAGTGFTEFPTLLTNTLHAWRTPGTRFLVLCDQDQRDCVARKRDLLARIPMRMRDRVTIRIVCDELEAWYLGDLAALTRAAPEFQGAAVPLEWRRPPDEIVHPSRLIARQMGRKKLKKVALARRIGAHMNAEANASHSFNLFLQTLNQILADPQH